MTDELTIRRKFAALQMIVGLIAPLLYTKSIFNFSITASFGVFVYWFIFPFVCFLIISVMALSRSRDQFKSSLSGLWGAAISAYLVFLLPIALLGLYSATYSGGGANIGLGLLALAAPAALPIFMFIGFVVGESRVQKRAPNPAFKRDSPRSGRAP